MPLPDPVTSATLPCSDGTTAAEQSVRRASTDVAASGERAARRMARGSSLASAGLAVWGAAFPANDGRT